MILFSVAAIMVVAAFWIFFTIPLSQNFSVASNIGVTEEPGFWQIFRNGVSVVFGSATENLKGIFSRVTKKKTIVIE